jgi:AraC-like DNA-binding protein
MKIQVIEKDRTGVMQEFAQAIGARMDDDTLHIPESKGGGYIKGFIWDDIRLLIRNYYMKEEIVFERVNLSQENHVIFSFNDVFEPFQRTESMVAQNKRPTVLLFPQAVSSALTMPAHTFFRSVTIAVSRQYLRQMAGHLSHPLIDRILSGQDDFAFETAVTLHMIRIADEMVSAEMPDALRRTYLKLKCEEMLCFLFAKLMQREAEPVGKMHINDIKAIYKIKAHFETHLYEPPNIALLAREAEMSEPKLRKLFKQTFGKSIYDYFQTLRMQEAARLLKDGLLNVSDVGYRLGFTNLSHFGRVFERYTGTKPKKWRASS